MSWNVKIPMRDGVRLAATVYLPKAQQSPAPCVFTLTPYIAQTYHDRGVYFAAQGLPFLTVDVRGRGNSEGEFRPFLQEANDGHDVVEWLARQPYCNGKVAMWGGSYAGYDQWATAKELPPHLATFVPAASVYPGRDFPMRNNIGYPYSIRWLTFTAGRASQQRMFSDDPFWDDIVREWFDSGRPFQALDGMVGHSSPVFQEWLSHPQIDAYWDAYTPTPEQYARLRMPILTITGSYDSDQVGALLFYRQHLEQLPPELRARHYLVIGPWNHAGTRTPRASFGGLEFGPGSLVDLPELHLQWYRWTMQDGPKPPFLRKPVAYYVMGTDQWRYVDTLAEITAKSQPLYLDSSVNADSVFTAGSLGRSKPRRSQPDRYRYDPLAVSPIPQAAGESPGMFIDQRGVLAANGRQLVYHSEVFDRDTEVSGFFSFEAWLALDRPDTDFQVSIHEIDARGGSILLSTDVMRARYRESLRVPRLIEPGKVLRYDFNGFTFVSRQVRAGSRLRLVIDSFNDIDRQRNFNGGGVVALESARDAKPVTVTLFHDAAHPSVLHVPLGRPAE